MKRTSTIILFVAGLAAVNGQLVSTNIADGVTPPSVAPGAPDGVKAISDLERINLYNGQLAVSIPLLSVGGRGEAGYTMQAPVGSAPWTITMDSYCASVSGTYCTSYGHAVTASNKELYPFQTPHSPGLVNAKHMGLGPGLRGSSSPTVTE